VNDLKSVLLDEQLPEGWESRIRQPYGLTLTNFNKTVLQVEFGVNEGDWTEAAQKAKLEHTTPITPA